MSRNILIVDDDPDIIKVISSYIEKIVDSIDGVSDYESASILIKASRMI